MKKEKENKSIEATPELQGRISAAFVSKQLAHSRMETADALFQNAILSAMAMLKLSPAEYQAKVLEGGQVVFEPKG